MALARCGLITRYTGAYVAFRTISLRVIGEKLRFCKFFQLLMKTFNVEHKINRN